jgi:TorA maturation chaperone TorD
VQEETLAVRKKYMQAGLVVNPKESIPDDHIGTELEFIFYLCQKARQAEDEEAREALLRMQQDFFREHLVLWVSPLCNRLFKEAQSRYFKGVARTTQGFVNWDYQEIVSHFFD